MSPRNWRVATRLNAILLIPVLVGLVMGGFQVKSSIDTWTEAQDAENTARLVRASLTYANALYNERDVSAVPLLSGKGEDDPDVSKAREATDKAADAFDEAAQNVPDKPGLQRRLQLIREPVDDRVEQRVQRRQIIVDQRLVPAGMKFNRPDRLGREIADRDKTIRGQDEADWVALRMSIRHPMQGAQRHVEGTIFLIEPARWFDLRHVLAGRDLHADALLDELVLLAGRLLHVDPGRIVGDALSLGRIDDTPVAFWSVGPQHAAVDRSNGSALQAGSLC